MTAPTEQDRAVARRVLRRIAGINRVAKVYVEQMRGCENWPARKSHWAGNWMAVGENTMTAAVEGARLGREYAAALRGRS